MTVIMEKGHSDTLSRSERAGAAQWLWRWGLQFRERSERKNFWPPTFGLPGGTWNRILQFSLL